MNDMDLYMDISHILHKVLQYDYNLETILSIESFEREITLVAAPVTRGIQKRNFSLIGKKQKIYKMNTL